LLASEYLGIISPSYRVPAIEMEYRVEIACVFVSRIFRLNWSKFAVLAAVIEMCIRDRFQNPFAIDPKVNYTFLHGRNSIKTGYEFQAINTEIDDFNPTDGVDSYGGGFSAGASNALSLIHI